MSKLTVDQRSIMSLFQDEKADFLIPDYQRPYAWTEKECQTLWDDVVLFSFPDNNSDNFKRSDEYFLGSIVTFNNENNQMEVIDGQQRLTTLMLVLRCFYDLFLEAQDANSKSTKENIAKCLWKTDEYGKLNETELKINSEVATDNDKDEFLNILKTGKVAEHSKSQYAENYMFFKKKIAEFQKIFPGYITLLPNRLLKNCILLPIEAESQDAALRIFSTLNDRGKPLSDADIFKAQFYKYFSNKGQKENFIKEWKQLEEKCEAIFEPTSGTSMDEIFTRYMYYERAKKGIKSSTTEALRKFYETDGYKLLKNDDTFTNLQLLADFWTDVVNQDTGRFSDRILRMLFVLNYAPNGMWTYFVSVYFMQNKDMDGKLDDDKFYTFLNKTIAFIWAYAITNPGVNALRTPIYAEMVNIVKDTEVRFDAFKFDLAQLRITMENFNFNNIRPITKSMLTWWAFHDINQKLLQMEMRFDIEHIFSRNRQEKENSLSDDKLLEVLGNKVLLEKKINIRASDYKFSDKKKYYSGFTSKSGSVKDGTKINELLELAKTNTDFIEADIKKRNNEILDAFMGYLKNNQLGV